MTGAQDGGVVHCVYQQGDLYSGRAKATLQVFTLTVRISKKVSSARFISTARREILFNKCKQAMLGF